MPRYDLNNPDDPPLEHGDTLYDEARDRAYTDQLEQRDEQRRARTSEPTD